MFATLFINVFTVFLMMIPGYLIIKKNIISESTLKDFSHVIVKVLYPCLIFSSLTKNFTVQGILDAWQLPVSVFFISFTGYLIGLIYGGFFKSSDIRRRKSILFQFTVNNYSFLPLAIIANLYNELYMAALILSTLGAELAVWTIGMSILSVKEGRFKIENLKHLLAPPLISIYFSLIILLVLNAFKMSLQTFIEEHLVFEYTQKTIYQIGQATIPLSMIMVGGRMGKINLSDLKVLDIWTVALFRLLIIPFVSILLILFCFSTHPYIHVMLIVAVMPTSIVSMVLGELYEADQKVMSGTVLITHLLSLITIPVWLMFLL